MKRQRQRSGLAEKLPPTTVFGESKNVHDHLQVGIKMNLDVRGLALVGRELEARQRLEQAQKLATIHSRFTTMMVLRSFLCLVALAVAVGGECIPSMCDHGTCIDGDCQCEPNYSGADCSIPFETCEDGERTCFNGSTCVRNNQRDPVTNKYKYHCDCTKAIGVSSFAGLQCRQQATAYCILGRTQSQYAFCTNGGECIREVVDGQAHPGCRCTDDFEGQHCQYIKGTAPPEDKGQPYLQYPGEKSGGGATKGIVIFIIIAVCGIVVLSMGYVIYRKKMAGGGKRNETAAAAPDLAVNQESEVI